MMRKTCPRKEWIIIFSSIFIFYSLAHALDDNHAVSVQGLIMDLDLQKKIVVVNEAVFTWNQNTVFYNEQGTVIKNIDGLRLNTRVHIEGELGTVKNCFLAKHIYFLPKNVKGNRKNLSPNIKSNKIS
jgi:hypothetical protein